MPGAEVVSWELVLRTLFWFSNEKKTALPLDLIVTRETAQLRKVQRSLARATGRGEASGPGGPGGPGWTPQDRNTTHTPGHKSNDGKGKR